MPVRTPVPQFPIPPSEYDEKYFAEIIRSFSVFLEQYRNPETRLQVYDNSGSVIVEAQINTTSGKTEVTLTNTPTVTAFTDVDHLLIDDGNIVKKITPNDLGTRTLLATTTISDDSSIAFTTLSSTYNTYVIEFEEIKTETDGVYLTANVGTSGSADTGSNYAQSLTARGFNGSAFLFARNVALTGSNWFINTSDTSADLGTGTGENFSGSMSIFSANSTSSYKLMTGMTANYGDTPHIAYNVLCGAYKSTSAINYFRLQASADNLASGKVKLYGIK